MALGDDYGFASALNVRTGAAQAVDNEINDLKYANEIRRQNEAMATAKQQMLINDLEFQNGSNPYDEALIKQENQQLTSAIGKYASENPDYNTNFYKAAELKRLKGSMKTTPAVLRSLAYKDAIGKLNADLADVAKNPTKYDTEEYKRINQEVDNYNRFGNQKGEAAAQAEGAKPFVYTRPQDLINVPETLLKAGKSINNFNVHKGTAPGEYMTEPKPDEVRAVVNSMKQENARSIQLQAEKLGLDTPEKIDKWLTDTVVAGFEPKYSPGDPTFWYEYGLKKAALNAELDKNKPKPATTTPFDDLFDKSKPAGNIPTELASKVWNDTPKIKVVGNSGQAVDLTGQKMNYDGRYMTDSKGRRYLSGFVNVPLDVAAQTGIWDGDEEDGGISSAFLGKAVRRKKEAKDGKGATYVKVDYMMPIDSNDGTARQLYNSHAQPAKLVEALQADSGNQSRPSKIIQNGYEYTFNPSTGTYE